MTATRTRQTRAQVIAKVIKSELAKSVAQHAGKRVGVALSGGVDSCSIFAEMLEQGLKPIVVSFTPSSRESTDYKMARAAAEKFGMEFYPARVRMEPDVLEKGMRFIIKHGYKSKVEVESLVPMVTVLNVAAVRGTQVLFTGDNGGYFQLNKTAVITKGVRRHTDSEAIDALRRDYYFNNKSCCLAIRAIGQELGLDDVAFPYISDRLHNAFQGTLWTEVNKPRQKEPIRLAYRDWFDVPCGFPTRSTQINLHKGDSGFADDMAKILLAQPKFSHFRSPIGLYNAVARGEV